MINFDLKLNSLINKYGLTIHERDRSIVERIIISIWDQIPKDKKVAVWGAGAHTNELFNLVHYRDKNIVGLLDIGKESQKQKLYGFDIYDPSYLGQNDIDIVVISSYVHRAEMREEVMRISPNTKYIDFYEELEKKGIHLQGAFFFNGGDYLELYKLKKLYNGAETRDEQEKYLFELICRYLDIKDFVHFNYFALEYIREKHQKSLELLAFQADLEALFGEIKIQLKNRDCKDISIFVIDCLRSKDVFVDAGTKRQMPFITQLASQSYSFMKAFSTNLHTRMSILSSLTGKLALDDNLFSKDMIDLHESPLLDHLSEEGYRIYNYTLDKKFIKDDPLVTQVLLRDKANTAESGGAETKKVSPSVLWRHICDLTMNPDQPIFSLVHLVSETHRPHICGYHQSQPLIHKEVREITEYIDVYKIDGRQQTREEFIEQYHECLTYVDRQMEFYMDFLPSKAIKVILGDHGQIVEKLFEKSDNLFAILGCHDDRIHIPIILNSEGLESKLDMDLFGIKQLGGLLLNMLDDKLEIQKQNYVEVQFEPIYNAKTLQNFVAAGGEKFTKGFKAIRTANEKYVLYNDGQEDFYILPDEDANMIANMDHQEKLEKVKSYMKNRLFPDFHKEK